MRRRLLNLAAAVSLAVAVTIAAAWLASQRQGLQVSWTREPWGTAFYVERGVLSVYMSYTAGIPQTRRQGLQWTRATWGIDGWTFSNGWRRGPFGYESFRSPSGYFDARLLVPCWLLLLATLVLPCWWVVKRRSRREAAEFRCHSCGYDVRVTPDRCPECGAAQPAAPRPAA